MTKLEFITALNDRLSGLPSDEVGERIGFYVEMIEDGVEDGISEEEAVARIGTVDEIADRIIADVPFAKLAREKAKPKRRLAAWEIVLLAVGSPIWVPLLIAALVVVLALYIVLWSLIVSLWAVFASVAASAVGGAVGGVLFTVTGSSLSGIAVIGAGVCCAGLAIFLFFGCTAATRGVAVLTKRIALGIKKRFVGKEMV